MKCQYCERTVDLPFRCPFCAGYFCGDHRLPENHGCPELRGLMARRREEYILVPEKTLPTKEYSYNYMPNFRMKSHLTSSTEVLHMTAASIIVMAIGLSLILQMGIFPLLEIELWIGAASVFTSVCIIHELAHKAVAKYYGLWAEFRLVPLGVLVTLISIISPIKLISPGAVIISGVVSKKIVGTTALAGPLANIVLLSIFFVLSFLVPNSSLSLIMILGAMLSSQISLFNLIPFSVLDGAKVFWWNKKVWSISFFTSLVMTIIVTIAFVTF